MSTEPQHSILLVEDDLRLAELVSRYPQEFSIQYPPRREYFQERFRISPDELAATASAMMEEHKITSLVVVDSSGNVAGILHLHDLWGTEVV